MLLAQFLPAGWTLAQLLIAVLVIGGVIAIFYIIITYGLKWQIPQWVVMIFWVIVAVVIGVFAIKFLMTLL